MLLKGRGGDGCGSVWCVIFIFFFGHGGQRERHESPLSGSYSHRHCLLSGRHVPVAVGLLLLLK